MLESFYAEQSGNTLVAIDPLNRLAEQRRDTQHSNRDSMGINRGGIGGYQLINDPCPKSIDSDFVEDAVTHGGPDAAGSVRS